MINSVSASSVSYSFSKMSAELCQAIDLCIDYCDGVLNKKDYENYDTVISSLERVITAITLEDTENPIEWSSKIINDCDNLITDVEKQLAQHSLKPKEVRPGRPKIDLPMERILELIEMKMTLPQLAKMYSVHVNTIRRRMDELQIKVSDFYTSISDEDLEVVMDDILKKHPYTGYKRMCGFLMAKGIRVTVPRVRLTLRMIDPIGTEDRKSRNRAIHRRIYFVNYSREVYHIDTNMKLTHRYKIVYRSCIDGKSRMCIYLDAGPNNRATSGLQSFFKGIKEYGIPMRVRTDKGGENRLLSRFMYTVRGPDSNAVITGRSVHNSRIERFWGLVFTATQLYISIFTMLEEDGILDIANHNHLHILHHVYLPRINLTLEEFRHGWNSHPLSTERNRLPKLLFTLFKYPPEFEVPFDEELVEDIFREAHACHEEYVEDTIRNPGNIHHTLSPDQLKQLEAIDIHTDDNNYGMDIFQQCLEVL